MKSRTKYIVAFISLAAFLSGIAFTALFMSPKVSMGIYDFSENAINYISFIISFIAFAFSMVTYFSIDSVNSITSMDGNVLENENYSIAYEEVVESFKPFKDKESFTEELLRCVRPAKLTESCIEYADRLQRIIDYIIWFAYVDLNDAEISRQCEDIIHTMKNEKSRYDKLSNGINYLLNENVKLIEYVLLYQKIRRSNETSVFSKLENIRGEMLKNPVSRIVYYDYLGLDYRRKAAAIVNECVETALRESGAPPAKEFETAYMNAVMTCKFTEEQLNQFECFIERASSSFEKAKEYASDNILWDGYILYNKLRVDLMKHLVFHERTREEVLSDLDRIVKVRRNVQFLLYKEGSYLDQMFEAETRRAMELKDNYKNCINPEQ